MTAKRVWSGFAWRPDNGIDRLTGSATVRTMIDAGAGTDEVVAAWQEKLAALPCGTAAVSALSVRARGGCRRWPVSVSRAETGHFAY